MIATASITSQNLCCSMDISDSHIPIPQDTNIPKSLKIAFPENFTVSNLVRWASNTLQQVNGIDFPRLDAEIILSHLLSCKRIDLYLHPDKPVDETIAIRYKDAIQKRTHRVPLQYIKNCANFMSLDFYVDERVLIPRPETELLVEEVIKLSQTMSKEHEIVIADIGVGSGNIAVTLAKNIDNARILAIDISSDALAVANINARRYEVQDKITFLCGDTFKPLEGHEFELKIDFIVSNPPYISSGEFDTLQNEVRDYEPYVALVCGQDGLQMFKRIIASATTWLKPGGYVIFEVGNGQAQKLAQLFENTGYFKKANFIEDYQHIQRIVIAKKEETFGQNCH